MKDQLILAHARFTKRIIETRAAVTELTALLKKEKDPAAQAEIKVLILKGQGLTDKYTHKLSSIERQLSILKAASH